VFGLHFFGRRATPVVLQSEVGECGMACLAMVAGYHGFEVGLREIRQRFSTSTRGTNLQAIIKVAEALGLASHPLRCEMNHLRHLPLPLVLHWGLKHFVVLTELRGNRFTIHDPGGGKRRLSRDEVSRHFTGIALELTPAPNFIKKKNDSQRLTLSSVLAGMRGLLPALSQVAIVALCLEAFTLVAPLLQQITVDNVLVTADKDLLIVLAIGFGTLAVVQACLGFARSWALLYLGTVTNIHLSRGLFRHLLHLPLPFFEKRSLGDIASRFQSLDYIQRTVTANFTAACIDGLLMIGALGLMLLYSASLAVYPIIAVGLYAGLRAASFDPTRRASEEMIARLARQNTYLLETIRGALSIKVNSKEMQRQQKFDQLMVGRTNSEVRLQTIGFFLQNASVVLFGIESVLVLFVGATLVLEGSLSLGMLFAFLSYKLLFCLRASTLIEKLNELRLMGLHLDRLADILLEPTERTFDEAMEARSDYSALVIDKVTFAYDTNSAPVIREFSASIHHGETVAITGPSGAGKSTLVKLILGLLEPGSGRIYFQGHPAGTASHRSLFGAVMQDDTLFEGSIAENISFFDENADWHRVRAAARAACIDADIELMPMKYETAIGDMGSTLSSGQVQRVLLARALYRQPSILILDEATSHLDSENEERISRNLKAMRVTTIIVAHREQTIARASRILRLEIAHKDCR
jgi:ATP-binding cassette subfamily B protein RaxB